jgi:hypothetical protein
LIYVKHTYLQAITGWFDSVGAQNFVYPVPPMTEPGDVLISTWAMSFDGSVGVAWSTGLGTEIDSFEVGAGFGSTLVASFFKVFGATVPQQLTYELDPQGFGDGNHVVCFVLLGGVDAGAIDANASFASASAVSSINAPAVTPSGPNRGVLHFGISEATTTIGIPATDSLVRSGSAGSGTTGRTLAVAFKHVPGTGAVPAATFVDALSAGSVRYMGAMTVALTPRPTVPLYSLPISSRSSDTDWRFFLANSMDMSPVGELSKARGKSLTLTLNRGGSFTFQYNAGDELAEEITPLSRCVIAYRDGIPRWSGPVWSTVDAAPSNEVGVTCVGWFDLLVHRLIAPGVMESSAGFVSMDAGQIAMNLLCFANGRDASTIIQTPIRPGQVEQSQLRTRSYKRFQNIGQEIQALGDIESGFDCEVTPDTRRMNIWAKRSRDLTGSVTFGYRVGPIHNLESVNRQVSGDRTVNGIYVVGASPVASLTRQDDPVSQAAYGLMEEQVALSEVVDPIISLAYAAAELVYRSDPLTIYTIKPMAWTPSNPHRVPRPLDDYEVGDVVSFSAEQGRIHVQNQAARIFQMTISPEMGSEGVSLQTTLQGGS